MGKERGTKRWEWSLRDRDDGERRRKRGGESPILPFWPQGECKGRGGSWWRRKRKERERYFDYVRSGRKGKGGKGKKRWRGEKECMGRGERRKEAIP